MKKLIRKYFIIMVSVIFNLNSNAQTGKIMDWPKYIIGDYGISIKNKKIGKLQYYDCSESENECSECYGYFEIPNINFESTSLYIIGKKVLHLKDQKIDKKTLNFIEIGSKNQEALYFDKNGLYGELFAQNKIIGLKGYKHLIGHFFIKNNELFFADIDSFYRIDKTKNLDLNSIEPITGNFFMDKNGVYFANTYSYSNTNEIYVMDYIKIQDKVTNPEISITDDYCVINKKVYTLNSNLQELGLDYRKIQKLVIDKYDGKIVLSDGHNTYYRYESNFNFLKIDCNNENKKSELYCIEKDFSKIRLLRDTGYNDEYRFDIDNGVLYYINKENPKMEFENPSGRIFEFEDGYYLYDDHWYATKLKEVKVWDAQKGTYENLESKYYQFINREKYYYKGDIYGNHSRLEQKNFNIKELKIFEVYGRDYISDDKILIDFNESEKLDITKLKVLKMSDDEPTNYLTDGKNLIYDNQLIEDFDNVDVKVINQDLLITKNYIYSKGEVINNKEFKIPIKFITNKK